jgi:4-amino-4-deoxy-L-arabinose transferase-like glycosyltransferase
MFRLHRDICLGLLLAFYLIVSVGYSIAIPPGEGVDEAPHFDYVRYVKEHKKLPVQPMSRQEGVEVWMGHHPPLYYVLGALLISPVDTSDFQAVFRSNPHFVWKENVGRNGWNVKMHFGQDEFPWKGSVLGLHIVRFMTVALGAVALYAMYQAVHLLIPEHPWAPLGATALVGFNPSFLFMSSTVHHDTLQAAIFALTAWWALRYLKGPERWYDTWLGGVLIGAAGLTKLSGLTLMPFVGLTLLLKSWRDRSWQRILSRSLTVGTAAAVVAGWWFVRNQWFYGDPLGWEMFLNIHHHMVRDVPYGWRDFLDFVRQLGRTFWGGFGYMHITFPQITKYLWGASGLAGCGLLVGILRGSISFKTRWPEWLLIFTLFLLLIVSFVRFSIATVGAGHGRYLFPAGVSIGALFVVGLNGFTGWRHQRFISVLIAVGMVAYAIWLPVKFVLPKYASPDMATDNQLAQIEPVNAIFADTLELKGYKASTNLAEPGKWIHVDLYWQAIGVPEERVDPQVCLQVTNEQGEVLASDTRWPVPSLSPDVWSPEAVYITHMTLGMPTEGVTGQVFLEVGALSRDQESYLLARDESGNVDDDGLITMGNMLAIGAVMEIAPADVPDDRREVFASEIALRGSDLPGDPISPGTVAPVGLYWQVLESPSADYTVFIHVLDEQGELVTQFDRPPGGGTKPTSTWQVGQTLLDTYPLPIPSDIPAGIYEVRVGLYEWPSLERLALFKDGMSIGDSVKLGTIQIQS